MPDDITEDVTFRSQQIFADDFGSVYGQANDSLACYLHFCVILSYICSYEKLLE